MKIIPVCSAPLRDIPDGNCIGLLKGGEIYEAEFCGAGIFNWLRVVCDGVPMGVVSANWVQIQPEILRGDPKPPPPIRRRVVFRRNPFAVTKILL